MLVNNAGGALGLDPLAEADDEQWLRMYESNVLGTMRMTRALLRALRQELLAQPPHVNVDEIVVRPRDQATANDVHRR